MNAPTEILHSLDFVYTILGEQVAEQAIESGQLVSVKVSGAISVTHRSLHALIRNRERSLRELLRNGGEAPA